MTEPATTESDTQDIADPELDDGTERTSFELTTIDVALLTKPAVLRAFGGILIGLALLVWPDRSDRILARLVGAALIWLAFSSIRAGLDAKPRDLIRIVGSVAGIAAGGFLVLNPDRSQLFIGRTIGAICVFYAVSSAARLVRNPEKTDRGQLTVLAIVGAIGALFIVATADAIATAITILALGWILISLLVLVVSLDARTEGTSSYLDTTALVLDWLRSRPKAVDTRRGLYDKILYEGPTTQTRVIRFFTLMGFAAVIASMGVITDSTAVVIGAMLVAPLMTPLMGMAISLVMGWPNRLTRSALIAAGGIIFAIAIGVLLGLVAPTTIDTETNAQILARTSPTILDLITAIAAGAAGAYGLSRPDVSDALPGVAIAISLVPPLTVVGIAYSQADWVAGNGALLLFATNMVAILIIGGLTFIVTGVTPVTRVTENQHRVKTAIGVTCTAAVLVLGALLLNGAQIAADTLQQSTVESTIDSWLPPDSEYRLFETSINDGVVTAVIVGPSDGLPPIDGLAEELAKELGETTTVNVSHVVEERLTATGVSP